MEFITENCYCSSRRSSSVFFSPGFVNALGLVRLGSDDDDDA